MSKIIKMLICFEDTRRQALDYTLSIRPFCDHDELKCDIDDLIKAQCNNILSAFSRQDYLDYTSTIDEYIMRFNAVGVPMDQASWLCNLCESSILQTILFFINDIDDETKYAIHSHEMVDPTKTVITLEIKR